MNLIDSLTISDMLLPNQQEFVQLNFQFFVSNSDEIVGYS